MPNPGYQRSLAVVVDHRLDALSQTWHWLGRQIGVSASFMSLVRRGSRVLSPENLRQVARVLQISLTDLEFAQAVAKTQVELSLTTPLHRSVAYQVLQLWTTATPDDLRKLQHLCEKLLLKHRCGQSRTYKPKVRSSPDESC